ncbi:MAG: hypothetical protein JWO67_3563 [Streptosporangiaceae bacterium]|jgi:hypothetical protein|nr:hypothetical protein [Streptosporangiaceae bacterium]
MDLSDAVWHKSSLSGPNGGNCVEVAVWRKSTRSGTNGGACVEVAVSLGVVAVRDSKNPDGGALIFAPGAWRAFVTEIKRS